MQTTIGAGGRDCHVHRTDFHAANRHCRHINPGFNSQPHSILCTEHNRLLSSGNECYSSEHDGSVSDVKVIKGNPHFNDTVVIKAVRQWRYPPGNEDVGVTSATVYVTRNGCDADPPDLKPLSAVRPVYPPAAKTVQIQGGVESLLTAEKDGSVSSAEPLTGDLQLSQAAVDAVHQWGYPPMEKSTKTDVVLPFTIPKGESSADLVIPPLAIYQPDPASTRKNLTKVAKSHGIVQLEITVLADGTKGEEKVTKPLDTVRDEEALQTVKTREYLPALKSGMPVACKTPVSVYFRLF